MKKLRETSGLILIELVVTLILVGIIGIFTGLFLFTGMQGYITTKETSEGALLAQTALERISKELRDIKSMDTTTDPPVPDTSVTYWCNDTNLPGKRTISFADGVISITVNNDPPRPLLKNVKTFNLSWDTADLNDDGTGNISGITIGFNTDQVGQMFSTTIYPRWFYEAP